MRPDNVCPRCLDARSVELSPFEWECSFCYKQWSTRETRQAPPAVDIKKHPEHRSELYLRVYAAAIAQGMQNPHLVAKEALGHFDEEFGR